MVIFEAAAMSRDSKIFPADTGRNLNVHETFRRRPGQRLMYIQFTS